MKRILLLSAYHADSHAAWAEWLTTRITDVKWQVLKLPGRHFAWRIRGNPLSWLDQIPESTPDLVLATSMVDLSALRGLFPQLAAAPTIYYFHENQFAYPASAHQTPTVEHAVIQLYGGLCADRLLFNSSYNQNTFLDGVAEFAATMPDQVPAGLARRLAPKCEVLPVPVEPLPAATRRDHRLIVWNHRWEYDKHPELFTQAVCQLAEEGLEFRLALLGKRPRQPPAALSRIRQSLADRIIADGRLPRAEYRELLGQAGIVVSTSIHEFQGLGVLEAASAGVRPLVPDALCYPEQYPPRYRYPAGDLAALVDRLRQWLNELPPRCDVTPWLATGTTARWQSLLGVRS